MYPVYAREDVLGQTPLTHVDAATREVWLGQGAVVTMSRGKALRLILNMPPRTQRSLSMGVGVIEGAAEGKKFAVVCAEAWGWMRTPVEAANLVLGAGR